MNFEIIHDTVAKLVHEKVSVDARERRKVERYIDDKFQKELGLSQEDVDYIQPFLKQINLDPQKTTFVEEEIRSLRAAARKRRTLIVAVMSVILLLASFSIVKYLALSQASIALVKSQISEIELKINQLDYVAAEDLLKKAIAIEKDLGVSANTPTVLGIPVSFSEAPNVFLSQSLELLYYYKEAGLEEPAYRIVESLKLISKVPNDKPIADSLAYLTELFDELASDTLVTYLRDRYYPRTIAVAGGDFVMGVKEGDPQGRGDNYPQHQVQISDFEIGAFEVCGFQYSLFSAANSYPMPLSPPWGRFGDLPIVNVKWDYALEYTEWLSQKLDANFRLPTEAEWEYAAKGGPEKSSYTFAGSDELEEVAWTLADDVTQAQKCGLKKPNALGIYDLSGNVNEWCMDGYGEYTDSLAIQIDPQGNQDPEANKVARGGDYNNDEERCRLVTRLAYDPTVQFRNLGFRIVKQP